LMILSHNKPKLPLLRRPRSRKGTPTIIMHVSPAAG
jgi:hypothetical protein